MDSSHFETRPGSRPHILVVEDDRMVRETLTMLLEDEYHVTTAVSIETALASLRQRRFNFILLDCGLPGGSVDPILAIADRAEVPVVLTSGDPYAKDRVGPDRPFLPKPFTQEKLWAVLDSARG